jgi:hypothetical protein
VLHDHRARRREERARRTPTRSSRARAKLPAQLALVVLAFVAYMVTRSVTAGGREEALDNAQRLLSWERSVGLDLELGAQHLLASPGFGRELFTNIYVWAYWPVVVGALVFLWRTDRTRYRIMRDALFLSGVIGLVLFAAFPVAPPRMLGQFVDTVPPGSRQHFIAHPSGVVNPYAAFPSFHAGWFLLALTVVSWRRHRLVEIIAAAASALMVLAVVVTANHYVVDVLGGITICATALLFAHRAEVRRARAEAAVPAPPACEPT